MKSAPSKSLLRQAVLVVIFAQLACALAICIAALIHEYHARLRATDETLRGRSDSLLGAIQDAEDPEDNVTIDPDELRLPTRDVYAVYSRRSRMLGSSPSPQPTLVERHGDGFRNVRIGHTRYRVFEREAMRIIDRAEYGGVGLRRPVTIVYAVPQTHLWHEVYGAVSFYLVSITLATGISVVLVIVLLRRSLHPLDELAVAADRLALPALHFDPPVSVTQIRELRPLAIVLRDSVARVRSAFAREQRFVSDAAHELKTAIAVVRSSVQLLMLKERTVEEYQSGLERVLVDNNRVESIVAQMLQLARVEDAIEGSRGKPACDLQEIAAVALEQLRPFYEGRGIPVRLEPSPVAKVPLEPARALVLITNLVVNAVQHSERGAPVTLSFAISASEAIMSVEDAGDGISAEALPHIFERFYREDTSRARETGGTGLGLSICQAIVQGAGGKINAASRPGCGTRVMVIFTHN